MEVVAIEDARDVHDTTLEEALASLLEDHNMANDEDDDDLNLFEDMPPSPVMEAAEPGTLGETELDPLHVADAETVPLFGRWGIHRIGRKRPSAQLPHGGVEGLCALHRKSAVTGCKKLFMLDSSDNAAVRAGVARAKWWLAQAHTVERQWQHIYVVALDPVPSLSVIEAGRLDVIPEGWSVIEDDTHYAHLGVRAPPVRRAQVPAIACIHVSSLQVALKP
eukprot:3708309-Amphidinium_carterae.1